MFFTGAFDLAIDAKNRVSIPYAIRAKLNSETDGRSFYVLPGQRLGTLAIYPERYFEKRRVDSVPKPDADDSVYEWRQFELSQTYLLDPDSQGRILIPDRLLKRAGIEREVTLIGVQDHLELWPRDAYSAFVDEKWPDYPAHRSAAEKELARMHAAAPAAQPSS